MILLKNTKDLKDEQLCLTLGNFDGVHLGHRYLFEKIKKKKGDLKLLVLSFVPHPLAIVKGAKQFLINTYSERRELLKKEGVDFFFEIPFTSDLSKLSPVEFSQQFFLGIPNLKKIFLGHDSAFGPNKKGDAYFLKSFFKETFVEIEQLKEFKSGHGEISSTGIRKCLKNGNIEAINRSLGRSYFVKAPVVPEMGRGRRIGIPTINTRHDKNILLPAKGVYATKTLFDGTCRPSVTNIGINPTFGGKKEISMETHILNDKQDLYGKEVCIFFLSRLREEKKFTDEKKLVEQIKKDITSREKM